MPEPKEGESEEEFIGRCIPFLIKNEDKTQEQAAGQCYGMYRQWKKEHNQTNENFAIPKLGESKEVFIKRCKLEKQTETMSFPGITGLQLELTNMIKQNQELQALKQKQIDDSCETEWKNGPRDSDVPYKPGMGDKDQDGRGDGQYSTNNNRQLYHLDCSDDHVFILQKTDTKLDVEQHQDMNTYNAVALIGDRFYKNKYLSTSEILKAYKTMDGAYHDINHYGTTYLDGHPNIEYIIGYQDNTRIQNNRMITTVHVNPMAPKYNVWKNYVDVSQKAGRTPNVSVSFWASSRPITVKELPSNINYHNEGYTENSQIPFLYDLEFRGLATVLLGSCNDKDGCGIKLNEDEKNKIELLLELEKEKLKK